MKKITLLLAAIALTMAMGYSQNPPDASYESNDTANYPYWIEMMQNTNANVFETVKAFDKYWENRPERKGSGYNPFKRWEWYMKYKINPDGFRLAPDYDLKALESYKKNQRSSQNFSGEWENIGPILLPSSPNPFWGNGRINGIAFHPTDANIFYIGAPAGGLWKTENGGQNWETLTDDQPTLGVSSIVVDYNDPNIIYIGSGDRDAGDAAGLGVYRSIDGGQSWTRRNTGMGNVTVGRMLQHPTTNTTLFASSSGGIFKSFNSGLSWTQKLNGNSKDILFKPNDPTIMYAVVGAKFYRSNDAGENWTRITNGLPVGGGAVRAVIGVSPDDPDYIYYWATTSAEFFGLYRSTDGGSSFELRSSSPNIMGWNCNGGSGGQAWYDLDMTVDPLNAETIYGGGINCWKSTNGGQNWVMSSNQVGSCDAYPVHADLHVLEYNSLDGKLYVGNDGGIWWTDDEGNTWNRITDGLAIGQQYKLGQSRLISNHVTTGYQDNGISTFHTDTWIQSDMYADGMESAMDYMDTTLGYGCAQYGRMYRRVNDKATTQIAGQGTGGITEQGSWVTPFCQHETDPNVMFIGMQNLWRTTNLLDNNPHWTKISNGTGAPSVVEHSPADVDIFYFANSGGLFRSDNINDGSPAFLNLSSQLPNGGAVFDIETHPRNPEIVYIVQNKKVYKSVDRGLNWEDISGTLPDISLNDIAYYDRSGIEALYVCSNIGVFFKDEHMEDWVDFSEGLPSAILATEIEIFHHKSDPAEDRIRTSTYGRGLWGTPPYYYQPVAEFEASETMIPTGCSVLFSDHSQGYPQSWSWTFEGGSPETSTSVNPAAVIYNVAGTYEVSLTVTNAEGADTKTITAYIVVDDNTLPTVSFSTQDTVQCSNQSVFFYDNSQGCPEAWEWSFEPDQVTFLDGTNQFSQNPVLLFNENGLYTVSLKVTNSVGESELIKENYISIGGNFIPFYEDFQGASLSHIGWQVENPDGKKTWEHTTIGDNNQVVWMNFFNYTSLGQRDYLTSPLLNFQGFDDVFLTFSYAYAQRYNQKDSLIVNVSNDCGETWTRAYANGPNGEESFETAEPTVNSFAPTSWEEWCSAGYGANCPIIDLGEWAGQSNIKVQFETFANYGNNLYIQNVDISNTVGMEDGMAKDEESFLFFPNPTTGQITVVNLNENDAGIQLLDIHSKLVKSAVLGQKQTVLDVSELSSGVYFIRYTDGTAIQVKKLVIQ